MGKKNHFEKRVIGILLSFVIALTGMPSVVSNAADDDGLGTAGISQSDFLKADGRQIRKNYGSGEVVYLRGTNAGGYLLQEFWMCLTNSQDNVKCEMDIYNVLTQRFGEETMRELINYYQDTYWTEEDFDNCANLGMNCIRLPLWYRNLVDANGNLYNDAFSRIDWFVEQAAKRGIYVIIDMHGAPGSQNGRDHSGVDGNDDRETEVAISKFFWGDEAAANQRLYLDLWKRIAERYRDNPAVAGYDLLNEPFCAYRYSGIKSETELHDTLWDLYDRAYDTIRAIDPNHIIIMEATWDPWDLPNPSEHGWENVMYEYHQYLYDDYDNEKGQQIESMRSKLNNIEGFAYYNVPSYMGEFAYFNKPETWDEGLKLLNDAGLNWTSWTYKTESWQGNWGLFHHLHKGNSGENAVNIANDDVNTIREKWANVRTASENTSLTAVLKKYLPGVNKTTPYVTLADGEYYLTSVQNNKVIQAPNAGNDPLAALSDSYTGDAERLIIENNADGTFSIRAGANGKYVCAVIDDGNQLLARSDTIDTWEKFYAVRTNDSKIGIMAAANGKYVKGDFNENGGGVLKAESDSIAGAWEVFIIRKTDGGDVDLGGGTGEPGTTPETGQTQITDVPGTVQVKDCYEKSSEITFFTTDEGIHYAGNLGNDSYLNYYVNAAEAGDYTITVPLGGGSGDNAQWNAEALLVQVDDVTVGRLAIPETDWTGFMELDVKVNVSEAGKHKISFAAVNGAVNVADFKVTKTVVTNPDPGSTEKPEQPKTYTVTFDSNGGSSVSNQTVQAGGRADRPSKPTWEGYEFKGWYIKDTNTEYDFTTPVTNHIVLVARWEQVAGQEPVGEEYTVTFDSNGGSAVPSQTVWAGEKADRPADPTREGYEFKCWYIEDREYDFNAAVTADITLVANWERQTDGSQSGNNQSGDNQSGDNQSGNNQSGNNQSGDNQSGNNQTGNNQSGDNQTGNNQSGDNQSGNDQSDNNQTGNNQSGDNQSGNNQSGDNQSGNNQSGNNQSGQTVSPEVVTAASAEQAVFSTNTDSGDVKGSAFAPICLKATGKSKSVKLTWSKVKNASGYILYGSACGKNNKMLKLGKVSASKKSYTVTKLNGKALKANTYYKFMLIAYRTIDGTDYAVSTSKVTHVSTTKNAKYGNPKKLTVNVSKISIKKGKKKTIKAKLATTKPNMRKHIAKFRYESLDTSIATVTAKGVVKGMKKGTTYVYVFAQNGLYKRVKVTVK